MATRKKSKPVNVPALAAKAGPLLSAAISEVCAEAVRKHYPRATEEAPASKRGGARKGAGRPLEEGEHAVTRSLRLYPRTWARLMALAESSGCSEREVLEEALEAYAATLDGEGEE